IRGTCASDSQMQGVKPGGSLSRTHSRALRRTDLERVSIGLLESFEADEGGGQREEGCEGVGAAFVAQRQAAVAGEPGHGAFDDPPVAAEALLGLDILACQPRPDSPVS